MALQDDMHTEQEVWCPEWTTKLTCLTAAKAIQGLGLGVEPDKRAAFSMMHDKWRWEEECGTRQKVAREKEAREVFTEVHVYETEGACQEETARERESAVEVMIGELVDDEDEDSGMAMVVLPVAKPMRKGRRGTHISLLWSHHRQFSEAFPKGRKDFEGEDDLEGDVVTEATTQEDSRGKPRRVKGDYVRREDERCQSKHIACSMPTKAQRDHGVSENSGTSKGKAKAIARPSELKQGGAGPNCTSMSAHPWLYLVPMASVSNDVMAADMLKERDRSVVLNKTLNTIGTFLEAQVQNLKAQTMDLNIEVRNIQEMQRKYFKQLEYVAAQLGILLRKAQEFPYEDSSEIASKGIFLVGLIAL
ncbi:hypothetical protein PAXINDRAFT_10138 [Paxillus involutus ATCC 200175]|nr:hypothetical protein PAXINDRAFT_10138 [Paxillus involutus ATCC 200175]